MTFPLDAAFARDLPGLTTPWTPQAVPVPGLVVLNDRLASALGLDPTALRSPDGLAVLTGAAVPAGAVPVAQGYAGHQFGGFSPQLGDGRAVLLGEIVCPDGSRRDIALKGSGRTPWSRGGDGKAAIGPALREYLVAESMHALGVPTTRALAVARTGGTVLREVPLPGAVLTRVAASHIRVGTFQYVAARGDTDTLRRLLDHAIARHCPASAKADIPALAFLAWVRDRQADLIAHWMSLGFVHGVMNTDNMAVSGETIDYGPCAFMDAYDAGALYSSIDTGGRYAYGNQPLIAQWNLARLAEALLPLIDADTDRAIALAVPEIDAFMPRFEATRNLMFCKKIGLQDTDEEYNLFVAPLLSAMQTGGADFTLTFRRLADHLRGRDTLRGSFADTAALDAWLPGWTARIDDPVATADAMDRINPLYIPRNHLVEAALADATAGDDAAFHALNAVLSDPFVAREGLDRYALPDPKDFGTYRTFCGT